MSGARCFAAVGLAVALVVGAVAYMLDGVPLAHVGAALLHQPGHAVAASLALTAISFAGLAAYDLLGTRVVAPRRVPAGLALLAGASASAIANTLGFHAVTGSAVRAHLYLPAGLSGAEIARVASLTWLSLGAGNAAMLAAAELSQAAAEGHAGVHLAVGAGICAALASFIGWLASGARELRIGRIRLPMPSARLALVQTALGAIESGTAVGALYVLLPADLAPPFALFAVGCIASVAAGVVGHTPGGIGIFETSLTALLGGRGRADLLAALLVYRAIYNLLPFALAASALGVRAACGAVARRRAQPGAGRHD